MDIRPAVSILSFLAIIAVIPDPATGKSVSGPQKLTRAESSREITICHHPDGSSGNQKEITIPERTWSAHKKHGDYIGKCKPLELQKTIEDSGKFNSFRRNDEEPFKFLSTDSSFKFYSDGEVIKTLKNGRDTEFHISVTDTPTVLRELGVPPAASYQNQTLYTLYDKNGAVLSTGEIHRPDQLALMGQYILIEAHSFNRDSDRISFFRLNNNGSPKKLWSTDNLLQTKCESECNHQFEIPESTDHIEQVVVQQRDDDANKERLFLIDTYKGEVKGRFDFDTGGLSFYDIEYYQHQKLLSVVFRDYSEKQTPIYGYFFDSDLNLLAKVGPESQYIQSSELFTKGDTTAYLAGSKTVVEKSLVTGEERDLKYPVDFEAKRLKGSQEAGLLFLSGIDSKLERDKNPTRKVLVFDTENDTFTQIINFPPGEFGYNSPGYGNPALVHYPRRRQLLIYTPEELRIYEY